MKRCTRCKVLQPETDFPVDRTKPDGRHGHCRACRKISRRASYARRSTHWSDFIHRSVTSAKWRSRQIGKDFDLSTAWVMEQLEAQDYRCSLTGKRFELPPLEGDGRKSKHPYVMSIDRIDVAGGYTKDNVQLVCWDINNAKSTWDQAHLVRMIRGFMATTHSLREALQSLVQYRRTAGLLTPDDELVLGALTL